MVDEIIEGRKRLKDLEIKKIMLVKKFLREIPQDKKVGFYYNPEKEEFGLAINDR